MIVDIISDLHGEKPKLSGGDLLLLAGDYTTNDSPQQWALFIDWLSFQGYRKKIFIAGNHDIYLAEGKLGTPKYLDATYLCDSGCEFGGFKIWGSPWTVRVSGMDEKCMAFTCKTDDELAAKWALIPEDTDILITHSPPFGILDAVFAKRIYLNVGSQSLLDRVEHVRPELHVFGHVHGGYGQLEAGDIHFVNASHLDENYDPMNKVIRLEL